MISFLAFLQRDLLKDCKSIPSIIAELFLQPLLFLFVFGYILTSTGALSIEYIQVLVPGLIMMTAMSSSYSSVAVPLLIEIHYTKELEDRLMAPSPWKNIATAKMVRAAFRAFIGVVVFSFVALLTVDFNAFAQGILFWVSVILACVCGAGLGLITSASVSVENIDSVSSFVSVLLIFTGCAQYSWGDLSMIPVVQYLTLLNPLTYASELSRYGITGSSLPLAFLLIVLVIFGIFSWFVGIKKFQKILVA